jgi:hypothetical protein
MNQPSVLFCVVPVLPAMSATMPKRDLICVPVAAVDHAAHHVDQVDARVRRHRAPRLGANSASTSPWRS